MRLAAVAVADLVVADLVVGVEKPKPLHCYYLVAVTAEIQV